MFLVSIVGSVLLIVSMLALPLFTKVQREARLAGILIGVTLLISSLVLNGVLFGMVPEFLACLSGYFAVRFAKDAWRDFGDRRMVQRAEAYQARIDAERSAT